MPRTQASRTRKADPPQDSQAPFDLGAHRLPERFDVPIVDPNGHATPMVVTLLSRFSPEYRKRSLNALRAKLAKASTNGKVETPADEVEVAGTFVFETVISVTVDWSGFVLDGAPMECTPDTVRALYTQFGWLYEQVAEAYLERERFFVKPGNVS